MKRKRSYAMKNISFDLSSRDLHILAMAFMLADHMWAALFPNQSWLTCIGRIAYPIFAFLLVEGFFHTHDFKKYLLRMLGFAVVSEIPFNLLYSGVAVYPYHQNVMWTFAIALCAMYLAEMSRKKNPTWLHCLLCFVIVAASSLIATVAGTNYFAAGILTVFVFYFFRGRKWWCFLGQAAALYYLNMEILGGFYYDVTVFGLHLEVIQQGFALLALIPIWLYRGRKGESGKAFQYFCYGFYPVHCLILGILQIL